MNISPIRPGDIVLCDVRGHRFHAEVKDRKPGALDIKPISPGANYCTAKSRQVVAHYRKSKAGQ